MIEGLKPYPRYKDSGVPWLGLVPESWNIRRLKYLLREVDSRSETGEEQLLRVSQYSGVTIRNRVSETEQDTRAASLAGYKRVAPADLAINIMLAWNGSLGVSKFDGIVSPAYCVYRFKQSAQPQYYHELLRSPIYKDRIKTASRGVVESRLRLYSDDLYRIEALVPPPDDQSAIARFLAHAERKIRRYIATKRKLIKLLEEEKQAIIHRAVTRGLDPNVRLKPSGIDWLGDIPAHWEARKIRSCGSISGGMTPSMEQPEYWGGDIPWVTPKDMKRFSIDGAQMGVTKSAISKTALKLHPRGSVLLVTRGMILARRVPIAETTVPVTINQDMKAILPSHDILPAFLAMHLNAAQEGFALLIDEAGHGTKRLPTERWRQMQLAIPPFAEQVKIMEWLATRMTDIAAAAKEIATVIDLVAQYRIRLISDIVTGKFDVREAAAALSEEIDDGPLEDEADDEALAGEDDTVEALEEDAA